MSTAWDEKITAARYFRKLRDSGSIFKALLIFSIAPADISASSFVNGANSLSATTYTPCGMTWQQTWPWNCCPYTVNRTADTPSARGCIFIGVSVPVVLVIG